MSQSESTSRAAAPPVAAEPPLLIEDNALIGDLHTCALVARDGSVTFMCLPDFDSDACFASLLGTPANGRWKIAPTGRVREVRRRYRDKTLVLETDFVTDQGTVRLVDFMPAREASPHLIRWVEGIDGKVEMTSELRPRFGSGYTVPLVSRRDGAFAAVAGPDALYLRARPGQPPPPFEWQFAVGAGERVPFVLSWARPYEPIPRLIDADAALKTTEAMWQGWSDDLRLPTKHRELVLRSLITLKACTYRPSGAIVAAPTFGLPETPGGERNWDYRFCWVRDAVLTLRALIASGELDCARAFGDWLANAIGGAPEQLQIMYGIRGERRLTEVDLDWLAGYGGARPVRVGNGAYKQFQLDVVGELAEVLYLYVHALGKMSERAGKAFELLANKVAREWTKPDHGIWEMRGPTRHFTASKVSAWVAIDRWIRIVEEQALRVDKAPWAELRRRIFDEVCDKGFDRARDTFTQYYGSQAVDASLLLIPMSGFLPAADPRVRGTVAAIERELMPDGLVLRYRTEAGVDGLKGEEGAFLACSFWLANTYYLMGRHHDAHRLFDRVAALCNDVGLLAEEYLPKEKRQMGNFPQAFSHLALVSSAYLMFGAR